MPTLCPLGYRNGAFLQDPTYTVGVTYVMKSAFQLPSKKMKLASDVDPYYDYNTTVVGAVGLHR